jgi:ATP-dependent helicase Lhr and Lhr-like helicase
MSNAPTRESEPATASDPLASFSAPIRTWFSRNFAEPTRAQRLGWGPIHAGKSTLLLAPTGSGKTLAAFLSSLDHLMSAPSRPGLRVLYVSPLKALAVDVERNLRAPIAGIRAAAADLGITLREPEVAIRSGDTSMRDRARFQRSAADLLITTPESLYLLLTSQAARHFATLETVIVDEIHALLPTKRGVHLFLSLERLEALRTSDHPLQRIGLSATQRPLDEAARLLAGNMATQDGDFAPRAVEVVDARQPPRIHVQVCATPNEDKAKASAATREPTSTGTPVQSTWPGIHRPLVELIQSHRSTLVFVNSRRLAERLAQALNEIAGCELVLAHHGSLAKDRRAFVEDQLKRGALRALVATSSLELGIDMGAIDLVVQIEAPPSVSSGLQRIGRAGHNVNAISNGIVFPKHKSELLSAAAVVAGMRAAAVESTRYPRNPLDVLAQQIVAQVSVMPMHADALYAMCRRAAPFAELPRSAFDSVLELLSGRYPSDEFAELRPRITWDRVHGGLTARAGAKRIAVTSGGTIADHGLYGVFLSNSERPVRVGELDEEMVFESRVGDVFLLGATSWRIDEITHDRVLVSPAPGQTARMPFWKGARPGRPYDLGRSIGTLTRELLALPEAAARAQLAERHGFDDGAALTLLEYLRDQLEATGVVPSDRTIVIERFKSDLGDFRVCLLSPFGQRVHAPWAMALTERFRAVSGAEIDAVWSDDGIVMRLPETEERLEPSSFLFAPEEVESWVKQGLSTSSLFAAHFRENAGRALLLPKRDPHRRQPLWAQRRRAADLLRIASQYPSFPILLETYRECLRDVFELPALIELFAAVERREIEVAAVESNRPSPFATTIQFSYVGNFLYDADAPLEERRAQALLLNHTELGELLGEVELRELFDADVIANVERELLRLREPSIRHADDVHDLLLLLGDLTEDELSARTRVPSELPAHLSTLTATARVVCATLGNEPRYFAAEDAGKLRDAFGMALPPGLPEAFVEEVPNALVEAIARFARTHGPFVSAAPARRYGISRDRVDLALTALEASGRVISGQFLPHGKEQEWCDRNVLRLLKHRNLARLRNSIEPVKPEAFARLLLGWQHAEEPSRAVDALDRAIDQLQGVPLVASVLVGQILPARVRGFSPSLLDARLSSGELVFVGVEPYGASDGKVALYRTEQLPWLSPVATPAGGTLAEKIRTELSGKGAFFFSDLLRRVGGFPPDLLRAIWDMVWAGEVTNDTLLPFRSLQLEHGAPRGRPNPRARRPQLPGSEGRWSLVRREEPRSVTEQRVARAELLLDRYGLVSQPIVNADGLCSFSEVYPVLSAMEEAGKLRRGYFVDGLGGAQFARAGADARLRQTLEPTARPTVLAATDPANPYGSLLPWPEGEPRPQRVAGALVVLRQGQLIAYLAKTDRALSLFLAQEEPERERQLQAAVHALKTIVGNGKRRALVLQTINGLDARKSPVAPALIAAGFTPVALGLSLAHGQTISDDARNPKFADSEPGSDPNP